MPCALFGCWNKSYLLINGVVSGQYYCKGRDGWSVSFTQQASLRPLNQDAATVLSIKMLQQRCMMRKSDTINRGDDAWT